MISFMLSKCVAYGQALSKVLVSLALQLKEE